MRCFLISKTKLCFLFNHFQKDAYTFQIGSGSVIIGFDEAVRGMRIGGRRIARLPPAIAYGEKGVAKLKIPAGATLVVSRTDNNVNCHQLLH